MIRVQKYFGLDKTTIASGFRANTRAGNMPVCERCGALVSYDAQQLHTDWHKQGLR